MKANELRIGNWYENQDGSFKPNGRYSIVEEPKDLYFAELMLPITLTEEWLLKFGFEKLSAYEEQYMEEDYVWQIETDRSPTIRFLNGCFYEDDYGVPLKHAHQLQNLYFAITGEELTIVNQGQTPLQKQSEQ